MVKAIYTKSQVNSILEKYKQLLHQRKVNFDGLYLFGSYAKRKPRAWSDIDIAVISEKFGKDPIREAVKLDEIADEVSLSIEPHPVNTRDFKNITLPICREIRENGVAVE